MKGVIKGRSGPMSSNIEMDEGRIIHRHLDHIKPYLAAYRNSECIERQDDNYYPLSDPVPPVQAPDIQPRRSSRIRNPPKRYEPET